MKRTILVAVVNETPVLPAKFLQNAHFRINKAKTHAIITIDCTTEEFTTLGKNELTPNELRNLIRNWDNESGIGFKLGDLQ